MTAGYSATPLPQKLGIKPAARVVLLGAPPGFDDVLVPLTDGVEVRRRRSPSADVIVTFITSRATLARQMPALGSDVFPAGSLWVAWPKRASGVPTDITEDTIREVALPLGLVDNKVCAITEVWSGLRLVWRRDRRTAS